MASRSKWSVENQTIFHSIIYTLAEIIKKGIPLLVLPIVSHYIPPRDFGIWSIYYVLWQVALLFIGMGSSRYIEYVFYSEKAKNFESSIYNVISHGIVHCSVLYLLISIAYFGEFYWLKSLEIESYIFLVPLGGFLYFLYEILVVFLQNNQEAKRLSSYEIANSFFANGITVFLLLLLSYSWQAKVVGVFGGLLICLLGFVFFSSRKIEFHWNLSWHQYQKALHFCFPLFPHITMGFFVLFADRFIVKEMLSLKEVGIYSMAVLLGSSLSMLGYGMARALLPIFYRDLINNSNKEPLSVLKKTIASILILAACAIVLNFTFPIVLPFLLDEKFNGVYELLPWAIGAVFFLSLKPLFYPFFLAAQRNPVVGFGALLSMLVNLVAMIFFIRWYGIKGAVMAPTLAYGVNILIYCLALTFESQRYFSRS